MLANMPLEPSVHVKKALFGSRKRDNGYIFKARTAIAFLMDESNTKEESIAKINHFIDIHLLHLPYKPNSKKVSTESVDLQPTAKGFAFLQEYFWSNCQDVPSELHAPICRALMSPYNSLPLIRLQRIHKKVKLSTGLAIILWIRILGDRPRLFNDGEIDKNLIKAKKPTTVLNPSGVAHELLMYDYGWPESSKSPYAHKTGRHPNSTKLTQYWDNHGVLLFKELTFARTPSSRFAAIEEYTLNYVFTGRAIWQWIMDCTTVESKSEATSVARFLLRNGFLAPINDLVIDAVAATATRGDELSASSLYKITDRGARFCAWDDLLTACRSDEEESVEDQVPLARTYTERDDARSIRSTTPWDWEQLSYPRCEMDREFENCFTFQVVNKDPGMKLLFKEYLIMNHCHETLEFVDYTDTIINSLVGKSLEPRKEDLKLQISELKNKFLEEESSMQINISGNSSSDLLSLCNTALESKEDDYTWTESLMRSVTLVRANCMLLLDQSIMGLASHDAFQLPDFRSYVVSRYGNLPRPIC